MTRARHQILVLLIPLLSILLGAQTVASPVSASVGAPRLPTATTLYQFPLSFELNQGQSPSDVRFISRPGGMTLLLDAAGIRIVPSRCADAGEGFRLRFPGSAAVAPAGEQLRARITNYLIGNDRSRWVTSVRNYSQVRYANLYEGVDLVLHGDPNQLEFDVELAPAAQYQSVRLRLEGARRVSLSEDGGLVADTACGKLELKAPNIYQQSDGANQPIEGRYKLLGGNVVGFELGRFDPSRRLVIDPVLRYGTFFPEDYVRIWGLAADSQGAVYVTGTHDTQNHPLTIPPTICPACGTAQAMFVAKISPDGKDLVYLTYFGGSSDNGNYVSNGEYPVGIGVDAQGHAVVAGQARTSDFPSTSTLGTGQYNIGFITSFTADGAGLNYSVVVATAGRPVYRSAAIAVHPSGDAYVTGSYWGGDFPVTPGTVITSLDNRYHILALKITKDGQVGYAALFGAFSSTGQGTAIAVDSDGDAYIVGMAEVGLPTTPGAFQTGLNNWIYSAGPFVAKLNPPASDFVFLSYFAPAYWISNVRLGPGNTVYIAGPTLYAAGFGGFTDLPPIPPDGYIHWPFLGGSYVAKFKADGSSLLGGAIYGTTTSLGYSQPGVTDMAVDESGNVYITGGGPPPDLPLLNPLQLYSGSGSLFLAGFDAALTKLTLGSYFVGGAPHIAYASGNLFVSTSASAQSPTTPGALQESPPPSMEAAFPAALFLAKIDPAAPGASICPASTSFAIAGTLFQVSPPQPLKVTNCGNAAFTANAFTTNPEFTQTNDCVATAPGATCTINIGFAPTMGGNKSDWLVIRDAATNNRQDVSLSGFVTGPIVLFQGPWKVNQPPYQWASSGPPQLTFTTQALGTTSAAYVVELINAGNAGMYVDSISTSGDFTQTNDCNKHMFQGRIFLGAVFSSDSFCYISITFNPAGTGLRTGALAVVDSAGGSPQTVTLQGTATAVLVAPSTVDMGDVYRGIYSAWHPVTITNYSALNVSILGITTSQDFVQANDCPPVLAASTHCTVQVATLLKTPNVFQGTGTLKILAVDGEYDVALPWRVHWMFLFRPGRAHRYGTNSLSPGTPYSLELEVSAPTNVAAEVSLSCSGAPAGYACSVEPSQAQVRNDVIPITVRLAKVAGGREAGPGLGASTLTVRATAGEHSASIAVPVMIAAPEASSTQPQAALPQVARNRPSPGNGSAAMPGGNSTIPDNMMRLDSRTAESLVLKRVQPEYPTQARQAGIQGSVVVMVVVSTAGDVSSAGAVSGEPMLAPSAVEAAKQWKFNPNLLDGRASPFVTNLTMEFQLDPPQPQ